MVPTVTGKSKRRQEKAARRRFREQQAALTPHDRLELERFRLLLRAGKSRLREAYAEIYRDQAPAAVFEDAEVWFEEGDVFDNGAWRPLTRADIMRSTFSPAAAAPPDAQSLTCAATACPAPLASDPRP